MTGRAIAADRIESSDEDYMGAPADYNESLARSGALGVTLSPAALQPDEAARLIERFDGLVLTGGEDVDPSLFGQDAVPETYGHDLAVDHFEQALYWAARERGIPVLAICRGLQLLNVCHGGTLAQHIVGQPGRMLHGIPMGGGGSPIGAAVEPDSRLAEVLGETQVTGICHHHQAVDELGADLVISARASDGTIEGLEPADSRDWVVAVQWHPEDSAQTDPVQQRLFDSFAAACRARMI